MQQLEFLSNTGQCETDRPVGLQHPALKAFNGGYILDLQRFSEDAYGSSSKELTTLRLSIVFRNDAKTIYGQDAVFSGAARGAGVASIQAFQFNSFLETVQNFELTNGLYR